MKPYVIDERRAEHDLESQRCMEVYGRQGKASRHDS